MPAMPALSAGAEVDTSAATTYTDINGLDALKRDPTSPEALQAVSQQVEAMFLQMMLQSMREASADINPGSNEMGMYEDMFDKQVALSISEHADLGIARLLKKQLSNRPATTPGLSIGTASPSAALGHTPQEFVTRLASAAGQAGEAVGVDPQAIIAQAALETGWGQRLPRNADGSSSHNLFGIKAGADWTGPKATAESLEVVDGVAVPRRTTFRAYGSLEESVADFAKLLATSPRYRDALASGGDAGAYAAAIGRSGYATDPDYGIKLNHILKTGVIRSVLAPRTAKL
jgi:peptidoglycan hydrolase FlgJ